MAIAEFSKFAGILKAALSQHHLLGFEIAQQIDGETVETVTDFIFWGSQITADGDCSHEIKRRLLLERKVMTTLDRILKRAGRDTQKNCTKKIFMTKIITMV